MADTDILSLSMSASTIEQRLAGVATILAEGSRCHLPSSKRFARREALRVAMNAQDMLDDLIHALGGEP